MAKKIGFIFPGQGSQALGMLASLAAEFPLLEDTFSEASRALGYDLWQLVHNGPEEQLNKTEFTQPALLAASVSLWRVWQQRHGHLPILMAGHSLGEYSALVCAESLDFVSAIKLVARRGQLMQQAVAEGEGAMAAIVGLDDDAVRNLCDEVAAGDVLSPANYNSIGQTVIAGHSGAIDRALAIAKQKGAKLAKRLTVSVPSHCQLMQAAASSFSKELENIKIGTPKIAVLNNVDVDVVTNPDDIRLALVRQLEHPVRWVETVQTFVAEGIEILVECGPGKVLAGLVKRIDRNLPVVSCNDVESLVDALAKTV